MVAHRSSVVRCCRPVGGHSYGARHEAENDEHDATVRGPGYVTVYPCDTPRPLASNLNDAAGDITANSVVARLSATGSVSLFTLAVADLIVDAGGTLAVHGVGRPGRSPLTRAVGR